MFQCCSSVISEYMDWQIFKKGILKNRKFHDVLKQVVDLNLALDCHIAKGKLGIRQNTCCVAYGHRQIGWIYFLPTIIFWLLNSDLFFELNLLCVCLNASVFIVKVSYHVCTNAFFMNNMMIQKTISSMRNSDINVFNHIRKYQPYEET